MIDNPAVSGHHCKIYLQGDTFFIDDLNSTNGTFVNDKKIIRSKIQNNDIIGIVKHALVLLDERAAVENAGEPAGAEGTVVLSAASQSQMALAATAAARTEMPGFLAVLKGLVDKPEYELNGLSTYIGKSDRVQIPIKGLFAPEVAAMIAKRPEGYFLIALKENYPKHNGLPLKEKILLTDGDEIEISGTLFRFGLKK